MFRAAKNDAAAKKTKASSTTSSRNHKGGAKRGRPLFSATTTMMIALAILLLLLSIKEDSNLKAITLLCTTSDDALSTMQEPQEGMSCHEELLTKQPILPYDDTLREIRTFFESRCRSINRTNQVAAQDAGCTFVEVGQHLIRFAQSENRTMFTVQVGGMDGYSGDFMHDIMLGSEYGIPPPGKEGDGILAHWLPVVFEPFDYNFRNLEKTYHSMQEEHGLECSLLRQEAVQYNIDPANPGENGARGTCTFCTFNMTAAEINPKCSVYEDWAKLQLGTLQCDFSASYYDRDFDPCIARTEVACGGVENALDQYSSSSSSSLNTHLSMEQVSLLEADIEGLEDVLFFGLMGDEKKLSHRPPLIHFENKVLEGRNATRVLELYSFLEGRGYQLVQEGAESTGYLMSEG